MPAADAQVDRYAVVGNPVAHSLSPLIHRHFAEQTIQTLDYTAIEIAPDAFAPRIAELVAAGFKGFNVTVPFKQQAFALCTELSQRAQRAGAVNTIRVLAGGELAGENTDGIGLVRDLSINLHIPLADQRILLLGAGGAVRGVLGPILAEAPRVLVLCNRTLARAETLANDFSASGDIEVLPYEELDGETFDLVINGTAAGLNDSVPPLPASAVGAETVCYDMMYNRSGPTAFVAWARDKGAAAAHDGLGMLVEQAAEAFQVWRGLRPQTADLIQSLRST